MSSDGKQPEKKNRKMKVNVKCKCNAIAVESTYHNLFGLYSCCSIGPIYFVNNGCFKYTREFSLLGKKLKVHSLDPFDIEKLN